MSRILVLFLAAAAILASGCGNGAKIASVKIVDTIDAGGVFYQFEGMDNVQVIVDCTFDIHVMSDLDAKGGDEYRKALYARLTKGAHLFLGEKEIELKYGYWPEKTGSNYADGMTLFYVVPKDRPAHSLRFVYDGHVLGSDASGIDKTINP